jgi:hypothetical protein
VPDHRDRGEVSVTAIQLADEALHEAKDAARHYIRVGAQRARRACSGKFDFPQGPVRGLGQTAKDGFLLRNRGFSDMTTNVGFADRAIRILFGAGLLWFALNGPDTGYNWIGWIGIVPILTALLGSCPLYSLFGMSTCPARRP